MLPITDKGLFKVVDASQLELLTSEGWVLVAVMDEQVPMVFSDFENIPQPVTYSGGMPYIQVQNNKWHDQKTTAFLLRLDEETAIKQLVDENVTLRGQVATIPVKDKKVAELERLLADAVQASMRSYDQIKDLKADFEKSQLESRAHGDALVHYRQEVHEMVTRAQAIIDQRKRTAYERIAEGDFNDGVESVEERDVG